MKQKGKSHPEEIVANRKQQLVPPNEWQQEVPPSRPAATVACRTIKTSVSLLKCKPGRDTFRGAVASSGCSKKVRNL